MFLNREHEYIDLWLYLQTRIARNKTILHATLVQIELQKPCITLTCNGLWLRISTSVIGCPSVHSAMITTSNASTPI